jgi:hypothetical protein
VKNLERPPFGDVRSTKQIKAGHSSLPLQSLTVFIVASSVYFTRRRVCSVMCVFFVVHYITLLE